MVPPVESLLKVAPPAGACAAVLMTAAIVGCAGPGLEAGFDAPDPSARLHATIEAARENDISKLPQIVEQLESDDAAVRMLSICSLEKMTGETLGYNYAAPERERRVAVEAWRQRVGTTASAKRATDGAPSSVGASAAR